MTYGASIAHYRIAAKLGEGGMGEVWRATDTKLGRDVAIKILPEAFAADPDRMARFTREAQVLASLNHPNIAAIYGVEERALIMELVEGSELRGPLEEAVALGVVQQLIDALDTWCPAILCGVCSMPLLSSGKAASTSLLRRAAPQC